MKLHRDLKTTQKPAWHTAHRIREHWQDHVESFEGPVEIDEAYLGGKEKNKRKGKKLAAAAGPEARRPWSDLRIRGRIRSQLLRWRVLRRNESASSLTVQ